MAELCWILSTVTPVGLLERCHAYKDKIAQGLPADAGLLSYPVLQAADIVIHRAQIVPVGEDQKQHIEVTRDIAIKFNNAYGDILTIPEPFILRDVAVIPGVDGRKMSKTYSNTIQLFAPEKTVRKQVMGIVTDSTPVEDPKDPDTSNLYAIWKLFATQAEAECMQARMRAGGLGYGEIKKDLCARMLERFADARERREEWYKRPDSVEDVLRDGLRRARETTRALRGRGEHARRSRSPRTSSPSNETGI